jgi:pimeloyl-ACP methyl ester carboxylesterase
MEDPCPKSRPTISPSITTNTKPDYIHALSDFVRSRPAQSIETFMLQSDAVLRHDVEFRMNKIQAPTLINFGKQDVATSRARFAGPLREGIRQSELVIFGGCSHAPSTKM